MNLGIEIPVEQQIVYLRSLPAIREQCSLVFQLAERGTLDFWDYHSEAEPSVVQFCVDIIRVSI